MTLTADLFFSFRSPYSYLAVGRYRQLAEDFAVDIALRPVYPLAIREPDFFERNHPNWLRYTMLDMFRVAQFEGIPFGPPRPDPIVQDVATRKISEDQPYIRRITRLGQAAARRGKGLAFAAEAGASLNSLARAGGRRFGSAIGIRNGSFGDPRDTEVIARECGLIVPENELKWQWTRPTPTSFDFRGADRIVDPVTPLMASEDFAYLLDHCPGAYFFLGHDGLTCHHPEFDFDDALLAQGAAIFATLVYQRVAG